MSVYNQSISGGVKIKGCSIVALKKRYNIAFAAGDVVFNIHKAKKGVLEKIVIKQPRIVQNKKSFGIFTVIYVDTFNALWNERDLIGYSQAKDLAETYLLNLLEKIERLEKC